MGSNITHRIAQTSEVENMSKTEDREEISRMYSKSLPHKEQAIFGTKECNRTPLARNLSAESSKRILIVDDEKYIRDILSEILSTMGFEVVVASNGNEGLELFHRDCFDLVLTDLQMPGMDGWTLALRIKDESSNTPVVLITGFDREGIMEKLKGSCVDCAVFKPFGLEDIERTVQKILSKPPSKNSACTSTTNASLISSRAVQNPGPFP